MSFARTLRWPVGTISNSPGKRCDSRTRRCRKLAALGSILGSVRTLVFQLFSMKFNRFGGTSASYALRVGGLLASNVIGFFLRWAALTIDLTSAAGPRYRRWRWC